MFLYEMWIDKKEWEKVNMRSPKGYVWVTRWANRKYIKGGRWVDCV